MMTSHAIRNVLAVVLALFSIPSYAETVGTIAVRSIDLRIVNSVQIQATFQGPQDEKPAAHTVNSTVVYHATNANGVRIGATYWFSNSGNKPSEIEIAMPSAYLIEKSPYSEAEFREYLTIRLKETLASKYCNQQTDHWILIGDQFFEKFPRGPEEVNQFQDSGQLPEKMFPELVRIAAVRTPKVPRRPTHLAVDVSYGLIRLKGNKVEPVPNARFGGEYLVHCE